MIFSYTFLSYGASTHSSSFGVLVLEPPPEANDVICLFDSSQLPFAEGLYHFYHNGLAKAKRRRSLHHKHQLERDPRVSFPGNLPFNFCYHMQVHWRSIKEDRQEILKSFNVLRWAK